MVLQYIASTCWYGIGTIFTPISLIVNGKYSFNCNYHKIRFAANKSKLDIFNSYDFLKSSKQINDINNKIAYHSKELEFWENILIVDNKVKKSQKSELVVCQKNSTYGDGICRYYALDKNLEIVIKGDDLFIKLS